MRTSEDWNICFADDREVERIRDRLIRWGAEVLWFREEIVIRVEVAKGQFAYRSALRSMFKGYLFFRGIEPSELRERPGCPRIMRYDGGYAFLRASRMAYLTFVIGGEILREMRFQYIQGDVVLFQGFKATVEYVRNTAKGQTLTLVGKILGKPTKVEVASEGVELVSAKA